MSKTIDYTAAGVNIDNADSTKAGFSKMLDNRDPRVLNRVGAFSSLYDLSNLDCPNPVLVLKTEEPGSKQLLAVQYGRVRDVCFDMINHLTNDVIVMGAKPLTVQDAIICGKLEKPVVTEIVKGISDACLENETVLTGGETSEQPGVIDAGRYILCSSMVGIVDKSRIIDGSTISPGDAVLALESSGLHTNGYSLVRALIREYPEITNAMIDGKSFIDQILAVHRPYYKALKGLFTTGAIKGMAHITGGGIPGNLNRIIPDTLSAVVDLSLLRILPVFKFIRSKAGISDAEMLKTFNLGVGLVAVVKPESEVQVIRHLETNRIPTYRIGVIQKGSDKVALQNNLNW